MFDKDNFSNYYKTVIFVIMAILIVVFIGKIADVAIMFFSAFIISASLLPVVGRLKKIMPRPLSVAIILLAVLLCILLIFIPIAIAAINQIALIADQAPQQIDKILTYQFWGHTFREFLDFVDFENLGQGVSSYAGNILSQGFSAGKVIASSITSILMVTIMVFYLLLDEEHMEKAYIAFFPPKFKKKAQEILDTLISKIGGYVLAQILSMAVVGLLTLIGLALAHHPQTLLVAFLTFILDIIPVIGATVAVCIGVATAYNGSIAYLILILGIMLLAQWLQNQVAKPLLFGKFMDMHPLLIVVSILIGAKFLGFLGAVLGPAFACLICILVNELYIKQINSDLK